MEWLFLNSWFRYGPWHNASSDVPVQYYIFMHMKSNANCPTVCLPARLGRQRGDGNDSRTLGAAKFRHPPSAILRTTAYQYCTKVGQFSSFKKNMYCKYVRTIKSCIATVLYLVLYHSYLVSRDVYVCASRSFRVAVFQQASFPVF